MGIKNQDSDPGCSSQSLKTIFGLKYLISSMRMLSESGNLFGPGSGINMTYVPTVRHPFFKKFISLPALYF
jgi:hypothetical protein